MAWKTIDNMKGRLYIPDFRGAGSKHGCVDCAICQNCSKDRCEVCVGKRVNAPPSPGRNVADQEISSGTDTIHGQR